MDLWKSFPVRVVQPWDMDQRMVCISILGSVQNPPGQALSSLQSEFCSGLDLPQPQSGRPCWGMGKGEFEGAPRGTSKSSLKKKWRHPSGCFLILGINSIGHSFMEPVTACMAPVFCKWFFSVAHSQQMDFFFSFSVVGTLW